MRQLSALFLISAQALQEFANQRWRQENFPGSWEMIGIYTKGQRNRGDDREEGHAEDKGLQRDIDSDKKGGVRISFQKAQKLQWRFQETAGRPPDGAEFPNPGVAYEGKSKVHWQVLSHGSQSCKKL